LIEIHPIIKEEVFPKIYIIAYPNWITPYKMSMTYYGYNDKHIYTVIKKNKKHFKTNNKGEYLAKPDFFIDTIADYCELNKSEKKILKTLLDSESFRTIIGYSGVKSIEQIIGIIKAVCLSFIEVHRIIERPIPNEELLTTDQKMDYIRQIHTIVQNEFTTRDISIKGPYNLEDVLTHNINIVSYITQKCSEHLIEKLSQLPVPLFDDFLLSGVTMASLKAKQTFIPPE